ncbi:hypothetical protein L596_008553 [Steinernema carpocapsae]|uniref:Uncharacterized protein n=1 Tax=Steinernema carpocapsae TaxID=34508 RepID=A0A4U5PDC5_STECR|nr:hypothetical protein L596_008553 [Steinernema carpocapsae]
METKRGVDRFLFADFVVAPKDRLKSKRFKRRSDAWERRTSFSTSQFIAFVEDNFVCDSSYPVRRRVSNFWFRSSGRGWR